MEPEEVALSDVHVGHSGVAHATEMNPKNIQENTSTSSKSEDPFTIDDDMIGYKTVQTRFLLINPTEEESDQEYENEDEDGDIIVKRRKEPKKDVIVITHTMATRLKDVGLQVFYTKHHLTVSWDAYSRL